MPVWLNDQQEAQENSILLVPVTFVLSETIQKELRPAQTSSIVY